MKNIITITAMIVAVSAAAAAASVGVQRSMENRIIKAKESPELITMAQRDQILFAVILVAIVFRNLIEYSM